MGQYHVTAQNFSEVSENRMHSDEVAQRFGFKGALVPGVAIYGHLTLPFVDQLGVEWLSSSHDAVRLIKPAYHDDALTLDLSSLQGADDGATQLVQCHNAEGTLLAELRSQAARPLADAATATNALTNSTKTQGRPEITWETVTPLEPFNRWQYTVSAEENARYASEIADTLPVYQEYAHPHHMLSLANQVLMREYEMPAWIHVGSETLRHAAVRVGDVLDIQAVPTEKWERKGHQFIRLWIGYWRADVLVTEMQHTAIFKVAE